MCTMYNVGVPFVDEDVQPGWWRGVVGGDVLEEVEEFVFPDLAVDNLQQDVGPVNAATVEGGEQLPDLVEGSSEDEDDGEGPSGGDDDQWGPEDDAVVEKHID